MSVPLTFTVKTLGCKVNQVESEDFLASMQAKGFVYVPEKKTSDISIVNTCTVTSKADRKSLSVIRSCAKNSKYVFVTGCYSELEKDLIKKETGIHSIIEHKNKKKLAEIIEGLMKGKKQIDVSKSQSGLMHRIDRSDLNSAQSHFFSHSRSFVKLQDGCNDFCSYCRIPFSRGVPVSRRSEDVLKQVRLLKESGSPEIVLTGINLGKYEEKGLNFAGILRKILKEAGKMGVRISSIEPMTITDEVVDAMKADNLIPHIHLSLQSGSDLILKAMSRRYSVEGFYSLVENLYRIDPCFSITTDVIVGFPGEGQKEFEETFSFINQCRFAKLHVFPFSPRPLTKAYDMEETVSVNEKKERVKILQERSNQLYLEHIERLSGVTQKFVVEQAFNPKKFKYNFTRSNFGDFLKRYRYYYSGTSQYYVRGVLGFNEVPSSVIVESKIFEEIEPIFS